MPSWSQLLGHGSGDSGTGETSCDNTGNGIGDDAVVPGTEDPTGGDCNPDPNPLRNAIGPDTGAGAVAVGVRDSPPGDRGRVAQPD